MLSKMSILKIRYLVSFERIGAGISERVVCCTVIHVT